MKICIIICKKSFDYESLIYSNHEIARSCQIRIFIEK